MTHPRHRMWAIAESYNGECWALFLDRDHQSVVNTLTRDGLGAAKSSKIVRGGAVMFEFPGGSWVRISLVELLREL